MRPFSAGRTNPEPILQALVEDRFIRSRTAEKKNVSATMAML